MKTKSYHHYCDCAHPCMSFSEKKQQKKNSFKTGNVISKEFGSKRETELTLFVNWD